MNPDRDLAHTVGDARKRLTEKPGPFSPGDLIADAEYWYDHDAPYPTPNFDEVHAHADVDWTGPNVVLGED